MTQLHCNQFIARTGVLHLSDWKPSAFYKSETSRGHEVTQVRSIYGMKIILTEEGNDWRSRKQSTYGDFINFVAKFRTSDVLRALSVQPYDLFSAAVPMEKKRVINPWAAAAIARESILFGSEDLPRRDLSESQIRALFTKFAQAHEKEPDRYDEEGRPTEDWMYKILTQTAYEQYPWQESIYEELARTAMLFRDETSESHVLVREAMERALGVTIEDAIAAVILIFAVAMHQHGRWSLEALDSPEVEEVLSIVSLASVEVFSELLTADSATFVEKFEGAKRAVKDDASRAEQRYSYNPLTTFPIFRTRDKETLVPIPDLLYKRLAPSTLYYDGMRSSDRDFSNPLGHVVSHYVGMQLNEIVGNCLVYPEFKYHPKGGPAKQRVDSVDWFVVLPDCVLFIECKSLRLLLGERMGLLPEKDGFTDKLTEGITQINTSFSAFDAGETQEFDFLPRDRMPIGIVITSDPIYQGNTPQVRSRLPSSPIQTVVASLRDLEQMATWDANPLGKALVSIVQDEQLRLQPLARALGVFRHEPKENRLLHEFISQVPIIAWSPKESATTGDSTRYDQNQK